MVVLAAGLVCHLLFYRHCGRACWYWRRHLVRSHRRRVLSLSSGLCAGCWFAGCTGQRTRSRADAASRRTVQSAPGVATGTTGLHEFHRRGAVGAGAAIIDDPDCAGHDRAGYRDTHADVKEIRVSVRGASRPVVLSTGNSRSFCRWRLQSNHRLAGASHTLRSSGVFGHRRHGRNVALEWVGPTCLR